MKESNKLPDRNTDSAQVDGKTRDMREWARAVTKMQCQDTDSLYAFLQSKVEIIEVDDTLSKQEKGSAIKLLTEKLDKISLP